MSVGMLQFMPRSWHMASLELMGDEGGHLRLPAQFLEVFARRKLRPVAPGVHHAEEAERLFRAGAELVPGQCRHADEVVRTDVENLRPHQAAAVAVKHQDGVGVDMALERGEAVRLHLEVAQLRLQRRIGEQHLPAHAAEDGAALLLVARHVDVLPGAAALAPAHHGPGGPAAVVLDRHYVATLLTLSTNPRARTGRSSPALSSDAPMRSIASLP